MPEAQAERNGPGPLPEAVRVRAVSLAADALGRIPADQLPPRLRQVARFTPGRRARLAASQIAAALEDDDGFRDRVGTEVRVAVPAVSKALDEQAPPPAADPVEVAAVAYLLRAEGWDGLVDAARDTERGAPEVPDLTAAVDRLQAELRESRARERRARAKAKESVSEAKRENADLRRQLAEARRLSAAAEAAARQSAAAQESARKETAALETDVRRLRARVSDLEAQSSAARRSGREEREQASRRARLLLDTLLDSAQGLRRELALPPVAEATQNAEGAPATAAETSGTGMALTSDDPALLEELITLPRVLVIVDGYNVTKTAWPSDPLQSQRNRLLTGLASLVARSRAAVTVVFDGADLQERPPVAGPRGVRVMFSPPGVIADDTIRDLLAAEPGGRPLVVVSSDREVAAAAGRAGARTVDASALAGLLARA